jgi:hypothetical protein
VAFAVAAVFAGACADDPPAPAKQPKIALSGSYLSRTPGEVRRLFVLGERYSILRFEPCGLGVGEPGACTEDGTLTLTPGFVAFREKTTGRETRIPLEAVRRASTTLKTQNSGALVGAGEPLITGGDVDAFRAGGQSFEREQLVTPSNESLIQTVPCAETAFDPPAGSPPPRCMPRGQCTPWGRSQGMVGMNMLLSNDCNVEAGEICCGLMEHWEPCQNFQNSSCEPPGNCAAPRYPVPGKTNCGDALRPGTICCADPLIW